MEEFSIELGAKLKLDSLQEQINKASSNLKPLEITINTEKSEKKITALTEQISKLNNGFKIMENMGSLSSNLDVINKSLKSIATVIDKINKADGFNNLAKGLNSFAPVAETIKQELSSIKTAMESFKGVNLNIGFGGTNNKTASDAANRMALAELRQQEAALESAYGGFVNMAKQLNSAKLWNFKNIADDATTSMSAQIQALRQYINAILEINAVSAKGIDLTSVTSKFSGSADEIVTNTTKIATGEKALVDQTNQLKGLFGSGIDAEKLTTQLDAIKVSIDNVSTAISGIKFDDSTLQAFREIIGSLNTTIQQLSKSITELDGKPIISKTATTGIAQTTQEIQKAEAETQKLKQATEQIKPIGNALITPDTIKTFERQVKQIIYDEKELEQITRDSFSQFGDVTTKTVKASSHEIASFVVTVKDSARQIEESLRFSLRDSSDGKSKLYLYQGSSGSDNYARQLETDRKQTERNTAAVTNYTSKLKILKDEYLDVNASKPIQNSKNIEHLNSLYDEAIAKVNTLGTATKESFASSEASVKAAIAEIRSQVKIYREVESMANQLRAKPIETIKGEQIQLLREFEAKIESSGIALERLKSYSISDLSVKLGGVTDRQSLTEYLNMLVVAKAEFKALQAEQQIEKQAEKAETDKVTTAYKELLSTIQQIRNIQTNLLKLDETKDSNQILELEGQLKRLQESYQAIRQAFNSKFSSEQTTEINSALQTTIDKMATVQAKIDDVKASSVRSIKDNISNGTLENQIQTIENNYRRLGLTEEQIAQKTQMLRSLLSSMDASNDIESVISDYTKFEQELTTVQNNVRAVNREQQKLRDEANLTNKKTTLNSQIDVWLKKHSAAASEFGARLREIQQEIATADGKKLTNLQREFQEIKRQAELAGKATMTLGDKLKSKLGSLATYFSATMLISYAAQGIRDMYNNVLEVDSAMTELYRVTDLTDEQYNQLYDNMVAGAKKYGVALNDIIESTASWVRLGFEANTANQLAEITAMYQHVTDLDNDTAVKNLVTAYKGYQEELLNVSDGDSAKAVTRVADVYDKLGNEFAVTAADVGEGLRRSASSLEMAGNSFEEAAGMSTGITEVTQNAEQAGTSLNVVSLRLRGMKGQLEEIGEEVDENVESISKMQTHILNLTHGKVNIFKDNGEFKSTYQIFKEISQIWNDLTDTSRADLLETIAGKQRSNSIAALVNNWSNVEKAVEAASNAEGTAAAENEKYMQSMQGKLDAFNASWQALSNTLLSSDLLKVLIDMLTGVVNIIDGITDSIGVLGTALTAVGITAFIKNLD